MQWAPSARAGLGSSEASFLRLHSLWMIQLFGHRSAISNGDFEGPNEGGKRVRGNEETNGRE